MKELERTAQEMPATYKTRWRKVFEAVDRGMAEVERLAEVGERDELKAERGAAIAFHDMMHSIARAYAESNEVDRAGTAENLFKMDLGLFQRFQVTRDVGLKPMRLNTSDVGGSNVVSLFKTDAVGDVKPAA